MNKPAKILLALLAPATLPACVVTTAPGLWTVGPGLATAATIQAGCSFNGTQLQGDLGAIFSVACPGNCASTGGLWGSDLYTLDSAICKAGIHAGAIPPEGGVLAVRIEVGQPAYRGSFRNGVQSNDYGSYGKSFMIRGNAPPPAAVAAPAPAPGAPPPPPPPPPTVSYQVIQAGCSFNATNLHGDVGSRHIVSCPANCYRTGGTWGTDVYTGDSTICRAAIHAGFASNAGGTVAVVLEVGLPAYRGSTRNAIQSNDYGAYHLSFHLERP